MSLDSGYPSDSFEAYLEFIAKYGKTNLSESEF
jgi:C1A family cysteine protease